MSEANKTHPMRDAVIVALILLAWGIVVGLDLSWSKSLVFVVIAFVIAPLAYWSGKMGWGNGRWAKRIGWGLAFTVMVVVPCWVMIGSVDGEPPDDTDLVDARTEMSLDAETADAYDVRVLKMWDALEEFATNHVVEVAFSNGNHAAAFAVVSNRLNEGCQILQSATSIDEYRVGAAMVGAALSKIRVAMGKCSFPDRAIETSENLVGTVRGVEVASCKRALRLDYMRQKRARNEGTWQKPIKGELYRSLFGSYLLHPNDTLSRMALEARAGLTALDSEQCFGEVDHPSRMGDLRGMIDLMWPNGIGRLFVSDFVWEVRNVLHSALHETQRAIVASRITIAVTRYQNKCGKMPKDVNELIPAYLKAIPLDPCSGRPVHVDMAKNAMKFGLDDGWHVYPSGD